MKQRAAFTLVLLGLAGTALTTEAVNARPTILARGAKKAPAKKVSRPAQLKKKLGLSPKGMHFGIGIDELSRVYAKELERDFVQLFKRAEPGREMQELQSELDEKKAHIKRNFMEFGSLPSGLDGTYLEPEYSYRNGEGMTKLRLRSGTVRHFFFFGDSLWKVYDVHKLTRSKRKKFGKDFESIVEGVGKKLGVAARVMEADPSAGKRRLRAFADWQDGSTVFRIINLGPKEVAFVYIDQKVEESVDDRRKVKGDDGKTKLDSTVQGVLSD